MPVTGRLLRSMRRQQRKARRANEKRYNRILRGYRQRRRDVMSALGARSGQKYKDIREKFRNRRARAMQGAVSSGLSSTTARSSIEKAMAEGEASALARAHDREGDRAARYLSNLSSDRLRFMERRRDAYPNTSAMYNLLSRAGRASGRSGRGRRPRKRYRSNFERMRAKMFPRIHG